MRDRMIPTFALVPLLIGLVSGGFAYAAETVRRHPDERLGALVAEVVDQINSGDLEALERFTAKRYADSMLRGMTSADHARFLMNVHEGKSPLELCCYRLADGVPEGMAIAILHSQAMDTWSQLQIRFDAKDRIDSFMIMGSKPPLDLVDLGKLDDAGLARELDAFLSRLESRDEFSGSVLVARDGKPLFSKAYGLANREHQIPNRIDTKFGLGSMNKMFTAVAIAQLVEQGKLSFDDPIGDHLPEGWVSSKVGRRVRVRHLLNHTSGFGDYLEPFLEQAHFRFRSPDDYKEIVAAEKLQFEPGTRWSYSNTGFLLAGVIVSHVSETDYYDYIRRQVYGPAGMKNSDHYDRTRPNPDIADGYWTDEDGVLTKNDFLLSPRGTPAGGGHSTVEDLLAFDVALRADKLVGEEMRDRLFAPDPERNSPAYGYGFIISALAPDHEVGHGGTFPGVSAHLSMFLDSGYTFVALCNGPAAQTAYTKALELIERSK
ncbi:MAG: serine hydrolase [bacterium]|nr:serine hydrolase [bacterium]